ncbi:MAG: hypothetical protein ACJ8GN_04760 [Longimicrobiaceae bacterium]
MANPVIAPAAPPDPGFAADEAALRALAADPPGTVLVVSDLHLAGGRDPITGRFDRTENFFADEAFHRWLKHHRAEAAADALLVLNGDTFDFLRVVAVPSSRAEMESWSEGLAGLGVQRSADELAARIDRKEKRYGLGTEDFKCIWKLGQIEWGHQEFFAALREWLRTGGRLLVVKGNHDVELHWPLVRRALRMMLGAAPAGQAGAGALVFCDHAVRLANLYLEHGHRYEKVTRVEGDEPTITVDGVETIRLPSGSFVNRYLINSAEDIYPFLDNARPLGKSIRLILRRYPIASLKLVFPAIQLISRSWRLDKNKSSFARSILLLVNILAPILGVLLVLGLLYFTELRDAFKDLGRFRFLFSFAGLALPYLLSALAELFPRGKGQVLDDEFGDQAYRALAATRPAPAASLLYAVYGHTHNQDVQFVPARDGAPDIMYMNTGTWTPLFIDDRPDLMGRAFRPFIRFDCGGAYGEYRHQYLQWNDTRGRPDAIEILGPVRRSGWEGPYIISDPEPAEPAEPGGGGNPPVST